MRTVLDRVCPHCPQLGDRGFSTGSLPDCGPSPNTVCINGTAFCRDLELTAQVSLLAAAAYVNIFRMRSDDTFEADASLWCK